MKPETKRQSTAQFLYQDKKIACHKRNWWNFWKKEFNKDIRRNKKKEIEKREEE